MKTILLIDDEPELLGLLELLLKQLNYNVIAYPGAISIEVIKHVSPDVIILDYFLGDITGGDLCRQLKTLPEIQNIPVLLLSGDERLPAFARDSFADAYVMKPFDVRALHNKIKQITTLETS